jgi:hypothetical protein
MRVTFPLLCYYSLCISPEFFFPHVRPLRAYSSCISLLRGCVWCDFPRGGQAQGSYGWVVQFPHPSLIPEEPSTYHPTSNLFRASEPLLVLWASEVQIRYWFRWKLMPPFQVPSTTFLQPSWSLFQHIPSQQSCNIYTFIILFTFINLFTRSIHITHSQF